MPGEDHDGKIRALAFAVASLIDVVSELGRQFPQPDWVRQGTGMVCRHKPEHRTSQLAAFLKAVKISSTLRAVVGLLGLGHVQEAFALCRVSDEQGEDIMFLSLPQSSDGQLTTRRQQFLNEFFQDEFDDPEDALSTAGRNRVPREKIRAAIYNRHSGVADPSTALAAGRAVAQTFSGFVHGAYEHIMDMYGGNPPSYHMAGMRGTPRIDEAIRTVPSYIYRGMVAIEGFCRTSGRPDLVSRLRGLSEAVNTQFLQSVPNPPSETG